MTLEKYFVAIDANGLPRAQRTSLRKTVYLSATPSGSFASKPPRGSHSLRVVEHPRAIEWVARATLPDGTKVSQRSRSYAPGRNYVLYAYVILGLNERRELVVWTNHSEEEWRKRNPRDELMIFAAGTLEVRHWPTPGDSLAFP
jgi:hypothetical protein